MTEVDIIRVSGNDHPDRHEHDERERLKRIEHKLDADHALLLELLHFVKHPPHYPRTEAITVTAQ